VAVAAGFTVIPVCDPVMLPVTASVARMDCPPPVFSVTPKEWVPASPAVKV
jgi:hypothetical protein